VLDAFEAAITSGRTCIEREDRVVDDDEASAQRADRRVERRPVRGKRARRERNDLIAVVLHADRIAAQALHRLEEPPVRLMAHRRFARKRELLAARVAVLALGAPGSFLEEKGVD
jgi:hypothetical protein